MSVELEEVRQFLAAHEPWARLPDEVLDRLPSKMTMRYIRRGETVIELGGRNDNMHIIRSGAVDVIGPDGILLDRVDVGRTFGYSTIVGDPTSDYSIVTVEDCLVLVLPREEYDRLAAENPQLTRFYSSQSRRLAHAARELEISRATDQSTAGVLHQSVGAVVAGRSPITVDRGATVSEAARRMAEHDISSILITREGHVDGIITDKDLRARVVAAGLDSTVPVTEVMTSNLITLDPEQLVFEALLVMSEFNIHHLPVTSPSSVLGVITSGDISRLLRANPVYLAGDIEGLSLPDLEGAFRRAAETISRSLTQTISAGEAARVLTSVADALVRRLVVLAERELGPAPVEWCFVAVGSQGRREMGPASDQDNALVLSDDYVEAEHGEYFAKLAEFICSGLDSAGQVLCPGDMMAANPQWRMTRSEWIHTFRTWVGAPQPDALLNAQIYFDMRPLAGTSALAEEVHANAVALAQAAPRLQAHLAALAVRREPPLGFFRGFVVERGGEYADTLDIKKGGTYPIMQMARLYALQAGVTEVGTRERLAAAAGQTLSYKAAVNLTDAFDYLSSLALQHQSAQLRAGKSPDYHIDPDQLTSMNRENLRDAFGIVKKMQTALAQTNPVRST
ncbi:Hypoxic response protein 1 [Corynebacterium guangdongense]|uniref:CBS domain-containing protein n=1 Tax=Corynebacterium guangdongense TaxID=1783348 RepID=A0ABU1ZW79_9CORY|nr:CBS domain-containing protein [Corynebacterium guangdongense]WJZ17758.1 Hypoxic response protein 1 [Corynebacterium guangdongense]